ncbi:MAG: hypothetical protein GX100_01975 [candidate division WS1 bacterium]|mgnify:CR=1 FL=1|jgi:hypothetical protein|nr:hypothetical protein [candidate division WS1 bacterium]
MKRLWAVLICGLLFVGGVWAALRLAQPADKGIRVRGTPSRPTTEYRGMPPHESIIVRQETAPGEQQSIEIQSTDQGVLIRPSKQ